MWRTGNFHTLLLGMWVSTATMKTTVEISQKSKITSTMQCKYPTSGICPKNWDQCTKEMPAVLCLSWYYSQQLRFGQTVCLSMGEWINNTWCTCTMEYYSSTKKKEALSFPADWMQLENIVLCEISQTQKYRVCMSSLICGRFCFNDLIYIIVI
jgi:hypothetical protein